MESKVVSLRIPADLLVKLDRLASQKYPNRRVNRSQIILDAIELIIEDDRLEQRESSNLELLSTVNDIVYKKLKTWETKILSEVENLLIQKLSTLSYSVDKNPTGKTTPLSSTEYDIVNQKETEKITHFSSSKYDIVDKKEAARSTTEYDTVNKNLFHSVDDRFMAKLIGASESTVTRIRQGKIKKSKFSPLLAPYKFDSQTLQWVKRTKQQELVEIWTVDENGEETKHENSPMERWEAEKLIKTREKNKSLNPDAGLYDSGKSEIRPFGFS